MSLTRWGMPPPVIERGGETVHPRAMSVILTEERDVWCARRGMGPKRCSGHCPTMRSRSHAGTKKIGLRL